MEPTSLLHWESNRLTQIVSASDCDQILHHKTLNLVAIAAFVGLLLGIVGISITDSASDFHANGYVMAAMSIFLAVFALIYVLAMWMVCKLQHRTSATQKKFLLAIGMSFPFLLIRMIYSSLSDFTDDSRFAIMSGNPTAYLFMSVLEEIVSMGLCVFFGWSASKVTNYKPPNTYEV